MSWVSADGEDQVHRAIDCVTQIDPYIVEQKARLAYMAYLRKLWNHWALLGCPWVPLLAPI